jgi:hypothetical protein
MVEQFHMIAPLRVARRISITIAINSTQGHDIAIVVIGLLRVARVCRGNVLSCAERAR